MMDMHGVWNSQWNQLFYTWFSIQFQIYPIKIAVIIYVALIQWIPVLFAFSNLW